MPEANARATGVAAIVFKDFVVAGRRWHTFVWRGAAVGAIGVGFILVYWDAGRWWDPRALSRAGREIFTALVFISYALVSLAAPAVIVGTFVEERDKRTLGLLLSSPLRPWQVALGKSLGSLLRTGSWLVGFVPLLFLLPTFGGIEPGLVPAMIAEVVAGGLLAAGIGLWLLSFKIPGPLLLIRTFMVLCIYLIVLPVFWLAGDLQDIPILRYAPWVIWNPLISCLDRFEPGAPFPDLIPPALSLMAGVAMTASGIAILTGRLARGVSVGESPAGKTAPERAPPGDLPVFWYETRIRSRRHRRARLWTGALALAATALLATAIVMGGGEGWGWIPFSLGFGLIFLCLIGAVVRGAWAGGDPRSEIPIMVSPLSPSSVAIEKIGALVRQSLPGLAAVAIAFVLAVASQEERQWDPIDILMILMSLTLAVAGLGSLSLLIGRATASATKGTVITLGVFVFVALGLPVFMGLSDLPDDLFGFVAGATDPLFFAGWVFDHSRPQSVEEGIPALIAGFFIAAALVGATIFLWEPVTRRRL